MKAVNIVWDTDNDQKVFDNLPQVIEIPNYIEEDCVADYLSDEFGFCCKSFDLK